MENLSLETVFLSNSLKNWGIMLIGIAILWVLARLFIPFLLKMIYRLIRRFGINDHVTEFIERTAPPARRLLVLIGTALLASRLNFPEALDFSIYSVSMQQVLTSIYQFLLLYFSTLLLMRIVYFFATILHEKALTTETRQDDQMILFVRDVLRVVIIVGAFFVALQTVCGIDVTALLAGAGIAGIAIALAAKDSLENLIASLVLFIESPFIIGDVVTASGVTGTIEGIGFRSTKLKTLENTYVVIPNSILIKTNVDNVSKRAIRKVTFTIGLLYSTSSAGIESIIADIKAAVQNHPLTNDDYLVHFFDFGESSLNVRVTYNLTHLGFADYLDTRQQINLEIIAIVQRHGSGFAFPTRTVVNG